MKFDCNANPKFLAHTRTRMNTITRPRMPITGPLRAEINRLAHRLAQGEENRIRADLTRRVEAARAEGAGFAELVGLLESIERESQT